MLAILLMDSRRAAGRGLAAAILLVAAFTAAGMAAQAQNPQKSMRGRVVDDLGRPVAVAVVHGFFGIVGVPRAYDMVLPAPAPCARTLDDFVVRSGEDGGFTFAIVGDGKGPIDLEVCKEGYLPVHQVWTDDPLPQPLAVVLARGGRIGGRVVAPAGRPVAGAGVEIIEEGTESDLQTTTDAAGRFILSPLRAGTFGVRAQARGYQQAERHGLAVETGSGPPSLELELTAGAVLAGTVRDAAGKPVAGAVVKLLGGASYSPDAIADAQGRYRLDGIEPGERSVWVELGEISADSEEVAIAPGINRRDLTFRRREIRGRVLAPDGTPVAGAQVELKGRDTRDQEAVSGPGGDFSFPVLDGWFVLRVEAAGYGAVATEPLAVRGAPRTGVDVRLSPGATLAGRIEGVAPAAMAEASVTVYQGDLHRKSSGLGAAGRYRVAGLAAGSWEVTVQSGDKEMSADVTLAAGEDQTLDLTFPTYRQVSGRVLGPDAAPIDVERLELNDPAARGKKFVTVGSDGAFSAELPDGTYAVQGVAEHRFSLQATAPLVVEGAPLAGVEIRLDARSAITGRLLALPPGVSELAVSAYQGRFGQQGRVEADGRYEIRGLQPGDWQVTAYAMPTGDRAFASVTLPAGGPDANLDLAFRSGGLTLSGSLAGFDPVSRYTVIVTGAGAAYTDHLVDVDAGGRFNLSGLTPGHYTLEVRDDGLPLGVHWPLYEGEVDLQADSDLVLPLSHVR